MKKRILGLLIVLSMAIPSYASITVSPTRLELNANKVRNNYATMAIDIKGETNTPVRYRAYTGYFKISEKSELQLLPNDKNDTHNISSKIRFVPSEFTVPPGKSQKVRVNIANIKNLPDGESRAIIFLEDINTKEMNVPNNYGISTQLILKTRVGVPVYVDKGNFIKKAEVESYELKKEKDGYYTNMKILSTGNSRVRYSGTVQIIEGRKLIDEYALNSGVVGENNFFIHKQKIKTDKITKAGEYTIRTILSYADEKNTRKNIKKDIILKITGEI